MYTLHALGALLTASHTHLPRNSLLSRQLLFRGCLGVEDLALARPWMYKKDPFEPELSGVGRRSGTGMRCEWG